MIEVFLFVALVALLGAGYLIGSGKITLSGEQRRGLVLHDFHFPTRDSGGSIWFFADRETAGYFAHFGKLEKRYTDYENGDTLYVLYVSRHVVFESVCRHMAKNATGFTQQAIDLNRLRVKHGGTSIIKS